GEAQRRSDARGGAARGAGGGAGALGGVRAGDGKRGRRPYGGARTRQGSLGSGPPHRQGRHGLQRGGSGLPGKDARSSDWELTRWDFSRKVAFATGGSRGIGRAIATALGRGGATVVIGYAGNEEAAKETCRLIESAGGRAEARRFDVADSAACQAAIEETVKAHGGLHVLVNNAGVAIDQLLVRLKDEDLERQLAINLKAAFYLCRAAARPMMKQRQGSIVNLGSVVGEMGNVGQTAYAATKAE